jgi:hypothetical protein
MVSMSEMGHSSGKFQLDRPSWKDVVEKSCTVNVWGSQWASLLQHDIADIAVYIRNLRCGAEEWHSDGLKFYIALVVHNKLVDANRLLPNKKRKSGSSR